MRPDPYKRARSRQYKAKHGLLDSQKQPKQQLNLPSNISDEFLYLSLDSEGTSVIIGLNSFNMFIDQIENECSNFSDNEEIKQSFEAVNSEQKYKYPKNLYTQIFPVDPTTKKVIGTFKHFLQHEFDSAINNSDTLLCLKKESIANNLKPVSKDVKLELKKIDIQTNPKESMPNSKTNSSAEKLALEDWLDDVL